MDDNEPSRVTVSCTVTATPHEVFALLRDPGRHSEYDGSGMVRGAATDDPITAVGDVFVMDMWQDSQGGEYRTENHVTAFVPDELIAWAPTLPGRAPSGYYWGYALAPADGGTELSHFYDWSAITHPKWRAIFPHVTPDQMRESLARLQALFPAGS